MAVSFDTKKKERELEVDMATSQATLRVTEALLERAENDAAAKGDLLASAQSEILDALVNVNGLNSVVDALEEQNAELIEALRGLVYYNTGPLGGPPEIWAAARAALAKAGGK